MKATRLLLGACVVALLNIGAIVAGFVLWHVVGTRNQIAVQLPVAYLLGIPLAAFWLRLWRRWLAASRREILALALLSLPCGALIFTGIHYLLSGYLTAPSNIIWLWFFQLTCDGPALLMVPRRERRRLHR